MLVTLSRRPVLAATLMLMITAGGCSGPLEPARGTFSSPALTVQDRNGLVAPGVSSGRSQGAAGFYPLDLGNQWHYRQRFSIQILPDGAPPGPPIVIPSTIDRDLICVESRSNARYIVEHSHQIEYSPLGTRTFDTWVRYRQDKSGLYEADVTIGEIPVCEGAGPVAHASRQRSDPIDSEEAALRAALFAAPGLKNREAYRAAWVETHRRLETARQALGSSRSSQGVPTASLLPNEITRLRYPLHPGTSWVIREDPLFAAAVEGIDAVDLPAGRFSAYRVRIDLPGGENDRVHFWFSRSGFLKLEFHGEGVATDDSGRIIGIVIDEETEELTGLKLAGPGRF
jgi:hypothetical protein